jgi:hypothetical protein
VGLQAEAGRPAICGHGQAADRLRRPRRSAGQLQQRLVIPLELAPVFRAGLCGGQRRFPWVDGLRQAFTDAIRDDWGGWPLEDLQKGLAFATSQDAQLDADNACALGASYGGYMMNWIAGQWPDRFKCLVQHDGVFDARAMAYETEELWFDEWEHGGAADRRTRARALNPVNHVVKWKTRAGITGEKDSHPHTRIASHGPPAPRHSIAAGHPGRESLVLANNSIQWYGEASTGLHISWASAAGTR